MLDVVEVGRCYVGGGGGCVRGGVELFWMEMVYWGREMRFWLLGP